VDQITDNNLGTTDSPATTESQAAARTYTQEEFDGHMSKMRKSIESKFTKQFDELGDINELKQIRQQAEDAKRQEAFKRGEFENILKELAAKKDEEIHAKNRVIEEYTVNTPLLNAAAQYKAVNPQQVVELIRKNVRLGDDGRAEVLDSNGSIMYDGSGNPVAPEAYVKSWLDQNPHFVAAAPSTSATKSSTVSGNMDNFDLANMDLSRPEHRELYKQARAKGLI
jgi:hypothetical protein